MKLSFAWLQQLAPLSELAERVGEKLTLHTAELEEIIEKKKVFENVFCGKLLSVESHKESEKLHIGQFDLGPNGKKQIVFGSVHVLVVGEILPIALDGACLASGINIKDSEVRGVESEGMVCDNSELGFSMDGILRFTDDKCIGKSLVEISPFFGDSIFDIDNKSLTHRPDLMGHRGFARELSTIFGANLILPEPVVSVPSDAGKLNIKIESAGCRRFCALKIEGITIENAPLDIRILLENLGVRSLNNFVDITNWTMLGFGQPMHVFDADKVQGDIVIRQAQEGEKIRTLDDKEYVLTTEDMVVADESGALSIAGVMGGLASSVTSETKNIIFEVANWDPVQVRKTGQRHGIRTESSGRYEKSLDPEWCRRALLGATEKALEFCPNAKITSEVVDEYPIVLPKIKIDFDPELVRKHGGVDISDTRIEKTLLDLGFGVKKIDKKFIVEVPSFRATKDVSIPADLVEEVLRMYGFEEIPSTLPTLSIRLPQKNTLRALEWKSRDFLSHSGYLEVYNHSFVKEEDREMTGSTQYIEIENPLSDEYQFFRRNLISNMLRNLEGELRSHNSLDFFEIGRAYIPGKEVLPTEIRKLLVFKAQMGGNENDLFFELKRDLEMYFKSLNCSIKFTQNKDPEHFLHPSKSAIISFEGQCLGTISVLHPSYLPTKKSVVTFAELDMGMLDEILKNIEIEYQKLSPYPPVFRDLSIVLDEHVSFGEVESAILSCSSLIQDIELFDDWRDENKLGKGFKNLAFHLELRSWDKTLKDDVIGEEFKRIVKVLKDTFQAQLRLEFDANKN